MLSSSYIDGIVKRYLEDLFLFAVKALKARNGTRVLLRFIVKKQTLNFYSCGAHRSFVTHLKVNDILIMRVEDHRYILDANVNNVDVDRWQLISRRSTFDNN